VSYESLYPDYRRGATQDAPRRLRLGETPSTQVKPDIRPGSTNDAHPVSIDGPRTSIGTGAPDRRSPKPPQE
jgi:hypothetical protein